ncbi:hypothetical protein G6F59_017001 [Rhizopus arrhizus]|nr:hypothetical protein G6F59_017001 [Rhizopus arrhizus]
MPAPPVLADVAHGAFLVHAAVPCMPQHPGPWDTVQAIARQAALALQPMGRGNIPAAQMVLAIVQAGDQRRLATRPFTEREAGVRMQHIHPVIESTSQAFMAPPLCDEQRGQAIGPQAVQLMVRLQPDQRS